MDKWPEMKWNFYLGLTWYTLYLSLAWSMFLEDPTVNIRSLQFFQCLLRESRKGKRIARPAEHTPGKVNWENLHFTYLHHHKATTHQWSLCPGLSQSVRAWWSPQALSPLSLLVQTVQNSGSDPFPSHPMPICISGKNQCVWPECQYACAQYKMVICSLSLFVCLFVCLLFVIGLGMSLRYDKVAPKTLYYT